MPTIAAEGLRVRREGRTVLDVPSFAIEDGEVLALIGPNGAGKSSLLQVLALLLPAQMSYSFDGRRVQLPQEALAIRRQMAVVFQEPLLLHASVFDNVALGLRLRRVPRQQVLQRVSAGLQKLGVAHLARRSAMAISGGEAQRVSLARALALEPRVLFLDEPFGALDVLTRVNLLQDLRRVLKAGGVAALFVTHDFAEIPPMADRVAVIIDGRVVQMGLPREVFSNPASPDVRDLVRAGVDMLRALSPHGLAEPSARED